MPWNVSTAAVVVGSDVFKALSLFTWSDFWESDGNRQRI